MHLNVVGHGWHSCVSSRLVAILGVNVAAGRWDGLRRMTGLEAAVVEDPCPGEADEALGLVAVHGVGVAGHGVVDAPR